MLYSEARSAHVTTKTVRAFGPEQNKLDFTDLDLRYFLHRLPGATFWSTKVGLYLCLYSHCHSINKYTHKSSKEMKIRFETAVWEC